jgi:hypothetical protein
MQYFSHETQALRAKNGRSMKLMGPAAHPTCASEIVFARGIWKALRCGGDGQIGAPIPQLKLRGE